MIYTLQEILTICISERQSGSNVNIFTIIKQFVEWHVYIGTLANKIVEACQNHEKIKLIHQMKE